VTSIDQDYPEYGVIHLKMVRQRILDDRTLGAIYHNDKLLCYTLEDKVRAVKVKHQTAIPLGFYSGKVTYSPRFGKLLPELLNVPNFEGVRIHSGNTPQDTSGCILVGESQNLVGDLCGSRRSMVKLLALLKTELFTIDITN
jgi:hypothetical protein